MKILDRGYWISHHFYWQSIYNVILNAVRFKSFTFFSACNPAIELGGMLHDKKTDIYELLPEHVVPSTKVAKWLPQVQAYIKEGLFTFPFIVKPNVGLKGFKVYKIESNEELEDFFASNNVLDREWLIQEYVSYEKEFSLLFHKSPASANGSVSSFVEKVYPYVTGDGHSSLGQLIDNYKNAFLRKSEVKKRLEDLLSTVPSQGENIILDYIGNYSRGAKFFSRMKSVNNKMETFVSDMFLNVEGLNFFRIDLKADSIADFMNGHFKILEVNGMKSEPLHIYDPESTFSTNYRIIKQHWSVIENITRQQLALETTLPSFKEGVESLRSIKKMVK